MKRFLVILLCFSALMGYAQGHKISGTVIDSTGNNLAFASVFLLQAHDSVMVSFALSDEKGQFLLENILEGDYILQITHMGYENHYRLLSFFKPASEIDLGKVMMRISSTLIETIEVKAELSPIRAGSDTVEYHAGAFVTRPGDVVEDLLKKLPGVEVERDGSVKAYGEDVKNVLVDGKEFFGKDTRLATKNLDADAVEKVQVFDKKSDMAEFTGVEDGQDERTINLKLKEGHKNGYFGSAEGEFGSNDRFKGKFNLHRFGGATRFSAVGLGNNINEQGFSMEEYINFMGGIGAFMSGGGGGRVRIDLSDPASQPLLSGDQAQGIQRSWASGLNLNHQWGKGREVSVNYFFNDFNNHLERSTLAENIAFPSTFNTSEISDRLSNNRGHNVNSTLRYKVDSFQQWVVRAGAGWYNSQNSATLQRESSALPRQLLNEAANKQFTSGMSWRSNLSATWMRRFRKKGRSITYSLGTTLSQLNNEGSLMNTNTYYQENVWTDSLNQKQKAADNGYTINTGLNFTEALGKNTFLQSRTSYSRNGNDTASDFYDVVGNGELNYNTQLSRKFDRSYSSYATGLHVVFNRKKLNLTFGADVKRSVLAGNTGVNNSRTSAAYQAILPSMVAEYELGMAHHVNMEYASELREPSLNQLQPAVDNRDPLNVYKGNPSLQPEYHHEVQTSYMHYDQFTFSSLFASTSFYFTSNKINDIVTLDSLYRRLVSPVNTDYERGIRSSVEYSSPIRPLFISAKLRLRNQWSDGFVFINGAGNKITKTLYGFNFSIENRRKEVVDLLLGYKLTANDVRYSAFVSANQRYREQTIYGEMSINLGEKWNFSTQADYRKFDQNFGGPVPGFMLWKAKVSRYFMAGNKLKVSLSVYDILNQNKGISRSSELNFTEISTTNVLGRYVMIGLFYSIKGQKKKEGIEIKFSR